MEINVLDGASTVVVLLSQDPTLVDSVPDALARRNQDVEVHVVKSVDGLQRHLGRTHPDAVVLDIGDLVEPDVTQALGTAGRVPTIVVDGHDSDSRRQTALAAGAVDYLPRHSTVIEQIEARVHGLRPLRRLDETEQHYKNILEASSDGIFVLVNGVFDYVNQAFAGVLQISGPEIVGRLGLVELAVPEQRAALAEQLAHLAVDDRAHGMLSLTLAPGGVPRQFEVSCRASIVGGRRAVVGVAREVTKIREMQREVENTRVRAAHVERLRVLGEIAAGVAHDFNNVLGTILGRVELAREHVSQGQSIAVELEVIERAARTAVDTVQRIRDFSRPSGDAWGDVDLLAVVREAAEFARTRVPASVRLDTDLAATPVIRGNAGELREVLINLINNALDAVSAAGVVHVRCCTEDGRAVIVVADNGHGMAPEVQKRIFEPFFSTKHEGGTGLGLSISHWILRRHDAHVQLVSEPDKGTSFRLTFTPLDTGRRERPRLAGGDLDVLVVDDDATVGDMIGDLLGEQGHNAVVIRDPAAALAHLAVNPAQLLITDLDLPDMSGWQLARRVREQHPTVLVGLITGWPLGASDDELKQRGVDFVLSKPFTIEALQTALTKAQRR
jgi:PAS domain S-box-containing protein